MPTVLREIYTEESEEELMAMSRKEVTRDLTERQRKFCEYYTGDFNIKTSAIKAGYAKASAHLTGWQVRNLPKVNRYICWLKLRVSKSCHINAMDLVDMYARIAFADMTDFVKVKNGRLSIADTEDIDGQIVKKIKKGRDGITIELEDRMRAMEKLENYFDVRPADWKQRIEERKVKILEEKLALDKKRLGEGDEWEDDGFLEAIEDITEEVWSDEETED